MLRFIVSAIVIAALGVFGTDTSKGQSEIVYLNIQSGCRSVIGSVSCLVMDKLPPKGQVVEQGEKLYTPYDAVKLAEADIIAIQALNNPELPADRMRYLDLRSVPANKRIALKKSLDFLINSLNTQHREIKRTAQLPAGGKDPVVIRVNLDDYGISAKAWDFLAENGSGPTPIPDPYFHITLKLLEGKESGIGEDSGDSPKQQKPAGPPRPRNLFAAEPGLARPDGGKAISNLIKGTSSKNPMLNGRWFLTYSGWAPAYYFLIGIDGKIEVVNGTKIIKGAEDQFENLAGFDNIRSERSQIAAVANSKVVTLHNRLLVRRPTAHGYTGGYYWFSKDTDSGIDQEDYMENILNFNAAPHKAKEIITTWLNTLQGYALTNDKRDLIFEASARIAQHGDQIPTRLQDKIVYAGVRNCALCHSEGLVKIRDQVRASTDLRGNIGILIPQRISDRAAFKRDKALYDKFRDAFKPDLLPLITHDNAIHSNAIRACNDLTPQQNRDTFEDFIVGYIDEAITLEVAAREVGWPVDKLANAIKLEGEFAAFKNKGISLHYTTTLLISQHPDVIVSRLAWESRGYAALQEHLLKLSVSKQAEQQEP